MQIKTHFSAGKTRSVFSEQIRIDKKLHMSAVVSASFLFAFAGLAVFPVASGLDTQAANTISETTLAMTTEDIALTFNVDNPNGTFSASDPTEFTVITNNYSGYTLSISAKEDDADNSKLINGEYEFNSISSASSQNDFTNGTWGYKPSKINSAANTSYLPAPSYAGDTLDVTAAANNQANTYSIALGAKADYTLPAGEYNNTFVITAIANPVGYQISYSENTEDTVTNMPSAQTGDVTATEVTIASEVPVRSGYTFNNWCPGTVTTTNGVDSCDATTFQPDEVLTLSQTTTNVYALKAMWNRTYTITFNANDGTGTMDPQTITGSSATLTTNAYTRTGYDFDGWNTAANGSGTGYDDEDTFTVPASGTGTTLYAQWLRRTITFDQAFAAAGKTKDATSNKYKMQDMTALICDAVTEEQETELVDTRDDTVYHVGKLLDGRCWMQDNLALNAVATKNILSPANTNATQAAINNFITSSGTAPQAGWATTAVSYETSSSVYNQPRINIASKNVVPQGSDPLASFVSSGDWKVGVYYNYCAASIGTYCYASGSGVDTDSTSAIDVKNDICPAGWRMPTGGAISSTDTTAGGGEYRALYNAYPAISGGDNQYTRFRKAFRLPLSGRFNSGSPNSQGSNAYVWSSTFPNSSNMHYLYASKSAIGPQSENNRNNGFSVRCIARNGEEPGTFNYAFATANKTKATANDGKQYYKMQDMSTSICNAVTTPTNTTTYKDTPEEQLVDIRDGKTYWVAKLLDGKCWMTQNLDLDLESTPTNVADLTHANTDLGWGSDSATTSWTPVRSTVTPSSGSFPSWEDDTAAATSADPGEWYWSGLYTSTACDYLATTCSDFSTSAFSNGTHGHVGNYYNVAAAIATNDIGTITSVNAPNSICPAGWRLPTTQSYASNDGDFKTLNAQYGNATTTDQYLIANPVHLIRGGYIFSQSLQFDWGSIANGGFYWTDNITNYGGAQIFAFYSNAISSDGGDIRDLGAFVRCIAR